MRRCHGSLVAGWRSGSVTMNVAPWPQVLRAVMRPWCRRGTVPFFNGLLCPAARSLKPQPDQEQRHTGAGNEQGLTQGDSLEQLQHDRLGQDDESKKL
jgi:hypothetical protein